MKTHDRGKDESALWRNNALLMSVNILTSAALVCGCGVYRARTVGVSAAQDFRHLLNDRKYVDIYSAATPTFKEATSEPKWIALCSEVHRKLGKWKHSSVTDTQVILVDSGGYIVRVDTVAEFDQGVANESVSFLVNGGKAALLSYNISSPALNDGKAPII